MKKGLNKLDNVTSNRVSCTASREDVANILDDLAHHVPEEKRVGNVFPFVFRTSRCDRQVCNVAVLAASCIPAKRAVGTARAQRVRIPNAAIATDSVKNIIVAHSEAVLATRAVAR